MIQEEGQEWIMDQEPQESGEESTISIYHSAPVVNIYNVYSTELRVYVNDSVHSVPGMAHVYGCNIKPSTAKVYSVKLPSFQLTNFHNKN